MSESVDIVSPFGLPQPSRILPSTRTFRGIVKNHEKHQVLAKQCSDAELVREVICNRLAYLLSLPVPKPFVIDTQGSYWRTRHRFIYASSLRRGYGGYPRSLQDSRISRDYLMEWPLICSAILFDEWIANGDRTPKNLLFAGRREFLLIDHGDAIPTYIDADSSTQSNELASYLNAKVFRDVRARATLQATIVGTFTQLDTIDTDQLADLLPKESWASEKEIGACLNFLRERREHLPSLIQSRFENPSTSLFG